LTFFLTFHILETVQLIENDPQNTGKLAEISNTFTNNIGKIMLMFLLIVVVVVVVVVAVKLMDYI
jgi:hypothetical protein